MGTIDFEENPGFHYGDLLEFQWDYFAIVVYEWEKIQI